MKRRRRRWTDEELLEISKVYSGLGRSGFASGDPSAYSVSLRRGLLMRMTWLGQRNNPFRETMLYKHPEWWDKVFPLFLVRKHTPQVKEIKEGK